MIAWVKVLSAEICPGPGPFDRIDGNRVGLSVADDYSPLRFARYHGSVHGGQSFFPYWNSGKCEFNCKPRMRRCSIRQMFARTFFRGVLLAVLILQTFASAAEATDCKPCPGKSAALCPSFSETSTMSCASSEDQADSALPATHDGADDHCSLCPLCLPLFINAAPVSISPDDQGRRFAASEHLAPYEAPSFSLLRPPIA